MTLSERLREFVAACFTGIWIGSEEHQEALVEIAQLCRQENWQLATWNISTGMTVSGAAGDENAGADPLAAIRAVSALATPDGTTLLVLQDFHRFLQSPEIVQAVAQQIIAGMQNRTILVVLAQLVKLPDELQSSLTPVKDAHTECGANGNISLSGRVESWFQLLTEVIS